MFSVIEGLLNFVNRYKITDFNEIFKSDYRGCIVDLYVSEYVNEKESHFYMRQSTKLNIE